MTDLMQVFRIMIIIQLFFSVSVTLVEYGLEDTTALEKIVPLTVINGGSMEMVDIKDEFESAASQQTDIPVIELGALVFYSGNILIDLILNFLFAIPGMVGIIINGLMMLVAIPEEMINTVTIFSGVIISVLYFLSVIQLMVGIRAGRTIT